MATNEANGRLRDAVAAVCAELTLDESHLNALVDFFVEEARRSLQQDSERGIPMIPTFVTRIPDGSERGLYLAADLGGSNFRVCSVQLNGDRTHSLQQMKWRVPHEVMVGSAAAFWAFLADCVAQFLAKHHPDRAAFAHDGAQNLRMGFTFSFPIHQTALNRGTLIRWTKGFDIGDAVGTDVGHELERALHARKLPVDVAAIVNDTVGCLLARSYETGSASQTLVGCILGTGTNAAYSEKISAIPKLAKYDTAAVPRAAKVMVVNTEWGSFDNDLRMLPNTEYDKAVNLATPNRDFHMFEKRVSGMFLGEIARRILEDLHRRGLLFAQPVSADARLFAAWSTDTSFLSFAAADASADLADVQAQLALLGVAGATPAERAAVRDICHAVALRSARLVAGSIAGMLKMTRAFDKFDVVDLGMDGAVIEFYPHYEEMIRAALRDISSVGPNEKRVTLGISKDGSGIGAALCAAIAQ